MMLMGQTSSLRLSGALTIAGLLLAATPALAQPEPSSPRERPATSDATEQDATEHITAALLIDSTAVPEREIRRALTRGVEARFVRLVDVDENDEHFVGTVSIVVADNGLHARILFSVDGGGSAHRDLTREPDDSDTLWIVEAVRSLISRWNADELLVPAAWASVRTTRVPGHELIDPWEGAYPTTITRPAWRVQRVPQNELVVPAGWNRPPPRTEIRALRELEPAEALSEPAPTRRRRSR